MCAQTVMNSTEDSSPCILLSNGSMITETTTNRQCCGSHSIPSTESRFSRPCVNSTCQQQKSCKCKRTSFDVAKFPKIVIQSCYIVVVVALLMVKCTVAFNIDVERAVVVKGRNGSMFGYTVAQHIDQSINWLLVGAPTEQTTQQGVVRGGAVFRCKTDGSGPCQTIPFDETGNSMKYSRPLSRYVESENKSHQWFGSTLRSSGESGVIVACAPRYVYFSDTLDKMEPVGVCYVAKASNTKFDKYSPCSTEVDRSAVLDQYNRQGYCQAGFSAVFSRDGKRLLIGAPGSWFWQGQLYNYKTDDGGVIIASTPEGEAIKDDTFMGYSSAIGEFDGDNNDDYVVGIPKADHYLGKVELFTQNLTVFGSLVGEQIGAYFGYALAVADLNGDRMDDIIVGAPMYAEIESTDAVDTGRVYIFYQSSKRTFEAQTRDTLDGKSSYSRFGTAVSSLKDINYDGYEDLCVGAPYAGENKKGAIYIFHGSKKGIITEVSQVIYAEDIQVPLSSFDDMPLETFGVSVSGGLDQDGNSYPDLLVGAYKSSKAVFLRTKPVVRVFASLKLQPEMISLDSDGCYLPDSTRVPCLTVYTCLDYAGTGVPDELDLSVTWVLDAKDNNTSLQEQRAFYTTGSGIFTETKRFKLQKKNEFCTESFAYVKKDPGDKLSGIKVTMEFKLIDDSPSTQQKNVLPPILDAYTSTVTSATANILKDCDYDNICVPDLAVSAVRVSGEHRIGSRSPIEVLVIVFNNGEDSFNTNLWIDLPTGVTYDTITNQRSSVAISCDTLKPDNTKVLCYLGNPMQKKSKSEFTLVLSPTNANDTKDRFILTFYANSTNPENADSYVNNYADIEIPVVFDAPKIDFYGKSTPEFIVLNTTEEKGKDSGRLVSHLFQLQNKGLTAVKDMELQIKWPSFDRHGNPLLVIQNGLRITGKGTCKVFIVTPSNASGYLHLGSSSTKAEIIYDNRKKRDANSQTLTCTDRYCTIIQCLIGFMNPDDDFVLTVDSHLMVRSFLQRKEATDLFHVTSIAFAKVLSVPFGSVDVSRFETKRLEVVTNVSTDLHKPASKGVEAWVIAVAVIAGILMLLLLILLLWWCGFFKRKKPEEDGYFVVNGKADVDTPAD